eukprot:6193993-Pleurochrysis_carterae.AAC.2
MSAALAWATADITAPSKRERFWRQAPYACLQKHKRVEPPLLYELCDNFVSVSKVVRLNKSCYHSCSKSVRGYETRQLPRTRSSNLQRCLSNHSAHRRQSLRAARGDEESCWRTRQRAPSIAGGGSAARCRRAARARTCARASARAEPAV